jgi:Leucine-rich repeat (LRR) protein
MLNNNRLEDIGNLSYLSLANLLLLDLSNNQLKKVIS